MSKDFVNIDMKLTPQKLREVRTILNRVEPALKSQMAKELRVGLNPVVSKIVGDYPSQAPLSGMAPRWGTVSGKVVTNSMSKPGKALALINVKGEASFARLLSITERAGSRSKGFTPSGRAMIENLQRRHPLDGKGGRFVFKSFRTQMPRIVVIAVGSIDKFIAKLNRGS